MNAAPWQALAMAPGRHDRERMTGGDGDPDPDRGLARATVAMYDLVMDTSVIERRGKVVARLAPPPGVAEAPREPWQRLRGTGELLAEPGELVLDERAFEAAR
jgi:hypothetical protein